VTSAGLLTASTPQFGEAQERWYATARGRVGYAVDRWLFFVSGGAAWTKVENSNFTTSGPANVRYSLFSDQLRGWTVGGGVEYAPPQLNGPFNGQWTIRAEYLYIDFGDYIPTAYSRSLLGDHVINDSTSLNNHIVRFGLAYKFGGFALAAPAVVK
jgi:outer membrane immunogenic protein